MTTATTDIRWTVDLGEPVIHCVPVPGGLAAGGSEGSLVVVDLSSSVLLRLHLGDFLLGLAASPDGTRLAAGGGERVAVWDLADGRLLAEHPTRWSSALAWSARSDLLAVGDGKQVRVLDRDGAPRWISTPLASTVAGLAFLRRDGRRVTAAAYRGVTIFEPDSNRLIEHLLAPGSIAGIAVAPNGRWVVGGSQDATLHGWKVPGGDDFRMSGFPMTVSRVAFESSGRWMACDGGDAVAFWDFSGRGPTGREAVLGEGHRGPITALAWHPGNARTLVTGDGNGDVMTWVLDTSVRLGERIRPTRARSTGDPIDAVAVVDGHHPVTGHRSGAITCGTAS
jgi:WD40 repeat protein